MRTLLLSIGLVCVPAHVSAQSLSVSDALSAPRIEYELGGAAQFAARIPGTADLRAETSRSSVLRFPDRTPTPLLTGNWSGTIVGEVSIFGAKAREDGRNLLKLGTAVTRGRTTTGVSIAYDEDEAPRRSELFVDYALTESFSLGVSGIYADEGVDVSEPVARLGLSAAYAIGEGTYVQGGVADAPDRSAVFGLSLGLRF